MLCSALSGAAHLAQQTDRNSEDNNFMSIRLSSATHVMLDWFPVTQLVGERVASYTITTLGVCISKLNNPLQYMT